MRPERNPCANLNHGRANPPVRFCPSCGQVVNQKVFSTPCPTMAHDAKRRAHAVYCVDCGEQLITAST